MSDRATAIRPVGGSTFSELDNWLEIMDVDPPHSMPEKKVMYERLLDILADTLEEQQEPQTIPYFPLDRKEFRKEMKKIIPR